MRLPPTNKTKQEKRRKGRYYKRHTGKEMHMSKANKLQREHTPLSWLLMEKLEMEKLEMMNCVIKDYE